MSDSHNGDPSLTRDEARRDALAARVEAWFEIPLAIATLMVIPVIMLEEFQSSELERSIANGLDWIIWTAFLVELVTMLIVQRNRWQWLLEHPTDLIIVVLTPPFLPAGLQFLRLLRLFRVMRLLLASDRLRPIFTFVGLQYLWLVSFSLVAFAGFAFSRIEPENAATANDGIWWAIVTATTVGYGDVIPATDSGRIIAGIVMFVGIGAVAITTASLARRYIESDLEREIEPEVARRLEERFSTLESHLVERLERQETALLQVLAPDDEDTDSPLRGF